MPPQPNISWSLHIARYFRKGIIVDMTLPMPRNFISYSCNMALMPSFQAMNINTFCIKKDAIAYIVTGGGGSPIYDGGIGESYHHFLLVELLPPETINIHVLDIHGNLIKTEVVTTR